MAAHSFIVNEQDRRVELDGEGGGMVNRTRRWFLLGAVAAPAVAMALEACARLARTSNVNSASPCGLGDPECSLLRSVIDELIPAGEGMPAASEVGSLEYLAQLARDHSEVQGELEMALARLRMLSRGTSFTGLSHPERVQALSELEKSARREFSILRDYTYEAYYTRSQVWLLIGYDGHSTPEEHWNDDLLLAPVRAMPRLYRPVM